MSANITVIIPTLALAERAELLTRAIDSVTSQVGVRATPLVVINGDRFDAVLVAKLEAEPRVQCIFQDEGNAPLAHYTGRCQVATPFYAFLDDDDELLPDGLKCRMDALEKHRTWDVVVTNGTVKSSTAESVYIEDLLVAAQDPIRSILQTNWMASCSALFRTSSVSAETHADYSRYVEWTYLGLKLAATHKIGFIDDVTYRINQTSGSVTSSEAYRVGVISAIRKMLTLSLPLDVQKRLNQKLARASHELSEWYRENNHFAQAWKYHTVSLLASRTEGVKYILYTRHLCRPKAVNEFLAPLAKKRQNKRRTL